jgi:hypothetical protein
MGGAHKLIVFEKLENRVIRGRFSSKERENNTT